MASDELTLYARHDSREWDPYETATAGPCVWVPEQESDAFADFLSQKRRPFDRHADALSGGSGAGRLFSFGPLPHLDNINALVAEFRG